MSHTLLPIEVRAGQPGTQPKAADPSWAALYPIGQNPPFVDSYCAQNLSTILACINAISSGISSLPAYVHRGVDVVDSHPISRLIRQGPNDYQTWCDWLEWTIAECLLAGNSVSQIQTDARGAVTGLKPAPFGQVAIQQ